MHCTQPRFTMDRLEGNTLRVSAERRNYQKSDSNSEKLDLLSLYATDAMICA